MLYTDEARAWYQASPDALLPPHPPASLRPRPQVEFLGVGGLFGFLISGVQTVALEREALAEVEWKQSIVLFMIGYALRYVRCTVCRFSCQSSR